MRVVGPTLMTKSRSPGWARAQGETDGKIARRRGMRAGREQDESGRKLAQWRGRTLEIVKREDEAEMKEETPRIHARGEE